MQCKLISCSGKERDVALGAPQSMDTDVIHPDSAPRVYAPGTLPDYKSDTFSVPPGGVSPGTVPQEPSAPRFSLPLRDLATNDGDQAVFRVFYQGCPQPQITWYFNSQPIKPGRDFKIFIDRARGESSLVIIEVFPEDEGEYMVKAENELGAAVTHCHLFVRCKSHIVDYSSDIHSSRTLT